MKGYRTLIFNVIMGLASLVGLQIAPENAQQWATVAVLIWVIGAIVLRYITTTPAFKALSLESEQLINAIVAASPTAEAIIAETAAGSSVIAPATGAATPAGPPTDMVELAQQITAALATTQSVNNRVVGQLQDAHAQVSNALPVVTMSHGTALPDVTAIVIPVGGANA